MTKYRVIRILEYVYDTPERMLDDQKHWQASAGIRDYGGTQRYGSMTIRFAVLPPEAFEEEAEDSSMQVVE
jgi:hypothetical protein